MISLTSCLNRNFLFPLLVGLVLAGCVGRAPSSLIMTQGVEPRALEVAANRPAPQVVGGGRISWRLVNPDSVNGQNLSLQVMDNSGSIERLQQGSAASWSWNPQVAGSYRVRLLASDALDQQTEGAWSAADTIVPPLVVIGLSVDRPSPQIVGQPLVWKIRTKGGVGALRYRFQIEKDGLLHPAVESDSFWPWTPRTAGVYRVRMGVSDALGNHQQSAWSEPYTVAAPIVLKSLGVDFPTPQMAGSRSITWRVLAAGGIGGLSTTIEVELDGGTPLIVQSGPAKSWLWSPEQPGNYRLRATLEDEQGNRLKSPWSGTYQIDTPLEIKQPVPGKPSPQAANTTPIAWMVEATGGVAPLSYEFELEQDGDIQPGVSTGALAGWAWQPVDAGQYRVRVRVTDLRGNRLESTWSNPYEIAPPLLVEPPVASLSSPQTAGTVAINWNVGAGGGVGVLRFVFELSKDGGLPQRVQAGPEPSWSWQPTEQGTYRLRAVLNDGLNNQFASAWSEPFVINAPLVIEKLGCDRLPPQAARSVVINWDLRVTGGVGPWSYDFELSRNGDAGWLAQHGTLSRWQWSPEAEGTYRVRAKVTDALGNHLQGAWSDPYEIAPALLVKRPLADNSVAQSMIHLPFVWTAQASGGVGRRTFTFLLEQQNGGIEPVQTGPSISWLWRPDKVGVFRVQVLIADVLGNQKTSPWSDWHEVRGPLVLDDLTPSVSAPVQREAVSWSAGASGGIGRASYEFLTLNNGVESLEQSGLSAHWTWLPRKAGSYRIKARVRDEDDHVAETEWSELYVITPVLNSTSLIAVLPVQNLTDVKAPVRAIGQQLSHLLQADLSVLPAPQLKQFMTEQRMRYVGGVDSTLAQALRTETGAEAVFISSLETWSEADPPRVALISRVVTTGSNPEIVWIDSVGLSGDDAPGLLGLGRINSAQQLLEEALKRLVTSFHAYLAGNDPYYRHASEQQGVHLMNTTTHVADGSFGAITAYQQPKFFYRAPSFDPARQYRVAVIPYLNINTRKHAGEALALHTVKQLCRYANIRAFEPGLVRQALLRYRMIMQVGPSLAASDILASPDVLGAELVVSGKVFAFQGQVGEPKADFSVQVFDSARREVIWASRSYASGNHGVYFFDWGRVSALDGLISKMSMALVTLLEE